MTAPDFTVTFPDGSARPLSAWAGRPVLLVNVASGCGLTPQYAGLEELHRGGLAVVGFPCNQFAGQEPEGEAEIQKFCSMTYGVTFPLSSKVEVNGEGRDPIYGWLAEQPTSPDGPGDIKWNFAKFLIGRDGKVIARYSPMVTPDDPELVAAIEGSLG